MPMDYLQMTTTRQEIEYGIERFLLDTCNYQEMVKAIEDSSEHEATLKELILLIADWGIGEKTENGLKQKTDHDDESYQLQMGDRPLFFNMEKNFALVISIVWTLFKAFTKKQEGLSDELQSIARDLFILFYQAKVRIPKELYCVYMFCRVEAEMAKGVFSGESVANHYKSSACKGWPIYGSNGKEEFCPFFGEGEICNAKKKSIDDSLELLCNINVLKPAGEDKYRFYR